MNYYHTPYVIDLIRYASVEIPQFTVPVPEQFRKLEVRENLYVPQSGKAVVSLFGKYVIGYVCQIVTCYMVGCESSGRLSLNCSCSMH